MTPIDEIPPQAGAAAEEPTLGDRVTTAGTRNADDVDAHFEAQLEEIFGSDHVSPSDLRSVCDHLRSYVRRLQARLRDEISDAVFDRCFEAIENLRSEKTADVESAVRRIRALAEATSARVDLIESSRTTDDRSTRTRPTAAQADKLREMATEFETLEARLRSMEPRSPPTGRRPTSKSEEDSRCTGCRAHDEKPDSAESKSPPRGPHRRRDDSVSPLHFERGRAPARHRNEDAWDNEEVPEHFGRRHRMNEEPPDRRTGGRSHDAERFYDRRFDDDVRYEDHRFAAERRGGERFDDYPRRQGTRDFEDGEHQHGAQRLPYGAQRPAYEEPRHPEDRRPYFAKAPTQPPFELKHYPSNPLLPSGTEGYPVRSTNAGYAMPWGPPHPGIPENPTMLEPFQAVVSYRAYRLNDVRAGPVPVDRLSKVGKLAAAVKGLVRENLCFDGREPIRLLAFLTDVKRGFDGTGIFEGLAVHVLQYFVEGDAARFYRSVTSTALRSLYAQADVAWPVLIHQFIRRYCPDSVLGDAYNRVTRMTQLDDEDELRYADRIQDAAMDCPGVFTESMLINYFVRGLPKTTQDTVAEQVPRLPLENRGDFFAVRKIAHAEGATYRARLRALGTPEKDAQPTPTRPTVQKPAPQKPVMIIGREVPATIEGPSLPLSVA